MQIVQHYRTITVPINEIPEGSFVNWDVVQTPAGSSEITIWWGEKDGG
jgi:hypothetical protein